MIVVETAKPSNDTCFIFWFDDGYSVSRNWLSSLLATLPVIDTFIALKIHDSSGQDGYPVAIKFRKDKNHGQDTCSCVR